MPSSTVHGVVWCGVVWCGVVWCGCQQGTVSIKVRASVTTLENMLVTKFMVRNKAPSCALSSLSCMLCGDRDVWSGFIPPYAFVQGIYIEGQCFNILKVSHMALYMDSRGHWRPEDLSLRAHVRGAGKERCTNRCTRKQQRLLIMLESEYTCAFTGAMTLCS